MTSDVKASIDAVLSAERKARRLSEELEEANQQVRKALENLEHNNFAGVSGSVREIVTYLLDGTVTPPQTVAPTQMVTPPRTDPQSMREVPQTLREAIDRVLPPYPKALPIQDIFEGVLKSGYPLGLHNRTAPRNIVANHLGMYRNSYERVGKGIYRRVSVPAPRKLPVKVSVELAELLKRLAPAYPKVWTIEQAHREVLAAGFVFDPCYSTKPRNRVGQALHNNSFFVHVATGVYRRNGPENGR